MDHYNKPPVTGVMLLTAVISALSGMSCYLLSYSVTLSLLVAVIGGAGSIIFVYIRWK